MSDSISGLPDQGLPRVKAPSSANAPSSLPKTAGQDYCSTDSPGFADDEGFGRDDFLPDLTIKNAQRGPYGDGDGNYSY